VIPAYHPGSRKEPAGFAERTGRKIVLQRQLADLRVQRFEINRPCRLLGRRAGPEHSGGTLKQMRLPRRDLVRVDVIQVRQLSQRLLALDGRQRHLRLEGRVVVPACTLRYSCS